MIGDDRMAYMDGRTELKDHTPSQEANFKKIQQHISSGKRLKRDIRNSITVQIAFNGQGNNEKTEFSIQCDGSWHGKHNDVSQCGGVDQDLQSVGSPISVKLVIVRVAT